MKENDNISGVLEELLGTRGEINYKTILYKQVMKINELGESNKNKALHSWMNCINILGSNLLPYFDEEYKKNIKEIKNIRVEYIKKINKELKLSEKNGSGEYDRKEIYNLKQKQIYCLFARRKFEELMALMYRQGLLLGRTGEGIL